MAIIAALLFLTNIAFVVLCIWVCVRAYRRRERWAKRLAVVVLVYALGIGPAFGLRARGYLPAEAIGMIYWPITNITREFPPINYPLWWYIHLWMPSL